MELKKILEIGIGMLTELIDKHDDGDSLVRVDEIIESINKTYSFSPSYQEISRVFDILNKSCSRQVLETMSIPSFCGIPDAGIYTKCSIQYLDSVIDSLKNELNKF